jgi:hypothetical protein
LRNLTIHYSSIFILQKSGRLLSRGNLAKCLGVNSGTLVGSLGQEISLS